MILVDRENNDITRTTTGSLSLVDDCVSLSVAGADSVHLNISAGSFVGTIVAESSVDGGLTWFVTYFSDYQTGSLTTSIVFATPNTAVNKNIVAVGGTTHVRVKIAAKTYGRMNVTLTATPSTHLSVQEAYKRLDAKLDVILSKLQS